MHPPKSVLDLPLVEITWVDAAISPADEGSLDTPSAFGGLIECRDIGYLIEKTRKTIKLASSITEEDNGYRHANTIPRGWVRRITYLARPSETLGPCPNEPGSNLQP